MNDDLQLSSLLLEEVEHIASRNGDTLVGCLQTFRGTSKKSLDAKVLDRLADTSRPAPPGFAFGRTAICIENVQQEGEGSSELVCLDRDQAESKDIT